jgi:hypothetical protein
MRLAAISLVLAAGLAPSVTAPAYAQGVQEVLATIRNGGGWVAVAIEDGRGTASTLMLPTMGVTLAGCVNVWAGHSGEWQIRARDTIGQDTLAVASKPGEGVRFAHEFGLRSQLEFEFEWSEPRDTTLFLWVGLDRDEDAPDVACTPK